MRRVLPAMLLGGVLAGLAQAQNWTDFAPAFPAFPCHDGWMACVVDGSRITPDLRGSPSNFRVDWFDLTATPSFSPFVGLSDYAGYEATGGGDAAALAEAARMAEAAKEEAIAAAAQRDAERAADEANQAAMLAQAEQQRKREESQELERQRLEVEQRQRQERDQAERDRLARQQETLRQQALAADREANQADQRARQQREREEAQRRKAAQEDERRRKAEADRIAAQEAERRAEQARLAAAAAAPTNVLPAPAPNTLAPSDDSCGELTRLEPDAMLGRLTGGQIGCLEGRVATDVKMTDKEKASLVLMANAWSSGDRKTWEGLVKRHLDQIDQSDPDICYKYALYLSNSGSSRAASVIRWVEVALDNRSAWTGNTYTSRVNSLYRLRAKASQDLWKQAEQKHAAGPTDETRASVEKYRNMTKVYAREWYEYALRAGKDTTVALQLCMSAAGTKDYCEAA